MPKYTTYYYLPNANADLCPTSDSYELSAEQINELKIFKRLGISQVISWVDGPASLAVEVNDLNNCRDISVSMSPYFAKIRHFVDIAHEIGLTAHLYTTFAISVRRSDPTSKKDFVFKTSLATNESAKFSIMRNSLSSEQIVFDSQSPYYPVALAAIGYPHMQDALIQYYIDLINESGADGLQIEPLSMPLDDSGVALYGYEEPIVNSFKEIFNKDATQIPNTDQQWIKHRASYSVSLIRKLHGELKKLNNKKLSVVGYSFTDQNRYLFDWQEMLKQKLLDEFYFRLAPIESPEIMKDFKQAQAICNQNQIGLIPTIDAKSYTSCKGDIGIKANEALDAACKLLSQSSFSQAAIYASPKQIQKLFVTTLARN